jgi:hypothetical protein
LRPKGRGGQLTGLGVDSWTSFGSVVLVYENHFSVSVYNVVW